MAQESKREKYLRTEIKKLGGEMEKFVSPANRGRPDDIVSWPADSDQAHDILNGHTSGREPAVEFVEVKSDGKKPTLLQLKDHERRRKMGFQVHVLGSEEQVEAYLKSRGKK